MPDQPSTMADSPPAALPLSAQVLALQAQMVFDRSRLSNLLSLPFAGLVGLLLWGQVAPALLTGWLAAKLAVCGWRLAIDWSHRRGGPVQAAHWLRRYGWAHVADGLVYGGLGSWLVPTHGSPLGTMLLATAICTAAVGFVVLSHHFGTLMAFVLPLMLPILAWQWQLGTPLSLYASAAGLLFLCLVVVDGWRAAQGTVAALRDRLRLDDLAAQRQAALEQAQQHSVVKNRFLATMSHEMRTPLHGMLGITRMLQRAPANAPPSERERQLVTLERAGEHLLALITDVLDFSRIESGQLRLATAPFDLAALVADVGELTQVSGRDKGLAVAVVGPLDGPCWVHGDAARLRQVLINLTGNAVKFTDQGTVTLSLARRADGLTVLQVSDTGPGIAPDDLGRVFEAFHQGDGGPMRRHGGTGLGLAIARELVRLMHGELDGANLPTGGACFSLRLPLPACAAPVQATPEPAHRLAGRVLLVEDNPVNAMVAEAMLARAGLRVDTVTDGAQAVMKVRDTRFDVVLMDCQMPVLDGIEATRCIRVEETSAERAKVTIVGLTANASDDDRQACLAAGMDDYLSKPFRESHLHGVLARYLQAA